LGTKGKSLVFYAYDLDQQAGAKNATFEAWGRRGPDRQQALSLGTFYKDAFTIRVQNGLVYEDKTCAFSTEKAPTDAVPANARRHMEPCLRRRSMASGFGIWTNCDW